MRERGGKLGLDVAGPLMLQTLDGLACAHEGGVVHRDIKPSNILLTRRSGDLVAKLSDMGLAKNFGQAVMSLKTREPPCRLCDQALLLIPHSIFPAEICSSFLFSARSISCI